MGLENQTQGQRLKGKPLKGMTFETAQFNNVLFKEFASVGDFLGLSTDELGISVRQHYDEGEGWGIWHLN